MTDPSPDTPSVPAPIPRTGPFVRHNDGIWESYMDGNYLADHATPAGAWAALSQIADPNTKDETTMSTTTTDNVKDCPPCSACMEQCPQCKSVNPKVTGVDCQENPTHVWHDNSNSPMSDPSPDTPSPTLADRFDEWAEAMADGEQWPQASVAESCDDLRAAAAQLRQLDRIKAAVGMSDPAQVAESLIESGDLVVPSAVPVAVDMLRRLVDALEAPDADT